MKTVLRSGRAAQRHSAFTLVEMLIALAAALLIGGAVVMAMVTLRKTFVATESYSMSEASQLRLLDSVATDLRRAQTKPSGVATSPNWTAITSGTTLTIKIPGYYLSGTTPQLIYGSVATSTGTASGISYGTGGVIASGTVTYRKATPSTDTLAAQYGSTCYIRNENGVDRVLAERADGILLEVTQSLQFSNTYMVRVRFNSVFSLYNSSGKYCIGLISVEPGSAGTNNGLSGSSDWVVMRNP